MHGDIAGWFEARAHGPQTQRPEWPTPLPAYCLLDYDAKGVHQPLLVLVTGLSKPVRTALSKRDYAGPRAGTQYCARNPRNLA
jgi:hypothetical protein